MPVRLIDPPLDEIRKLPTPLTTGEQMVLEYFSQHLGQSWEIYVQPHLNGYRPDFVLLNPKVGAAIIEVKDWDLDAIDYEYKRQNKHNSHNEDNLVLYGRRNGKDINLQASDPVSKILIRHDPQPSSLHEPLAT
jgi:hypothetical protein